jgi:hypothetical protein
MSNDLKWATPKEGDTIRIIQGSGFEPMRHFVQKPDALPVPGNLGLCIYRDSATKSYDVVGVTVFDKKTMKCKVLMMSFAEYEKFVRRLCRPWWGRAIDWVVAAWARL